MSGPNKIIRQIMKLESGWTSIFVIILGLLFIIIPVTWLEIKHLFKNPPVVYDLVVMAVSFFICGLAGFVCAIRKEFPPTNLIKGKLAVFLGSTWAFIAWLFSGYVIYLLIIILIS